MILGLILKPKYLNIYNVFLLANNFLLGAQTFAELDTLETLDIR